MMIILYAVMIMVTYGMHNEYRAYEYPYDRVERVLDGTLIVNDYDILKILFYDHQEQMYRLEYINTFIYEPEEYEDRDLILDFLSRVSDCEIFERGFFKKYRLIAGAHPQPFQSWHRDDLLYSLYFNIEPFNLLIATKRQQLKAVAQMCCPRLCAEIKEYSNDFYLGRKTLPSLVCELGMNSPWIVNRFAMVDVDEDHPRAFISLFRTETSLCQMKYVYSNSMFLKRPFCRNLIDKLNSIMFNQFDLADPILQHLNLNGKDIEMGNGFGALFKPVNQIRRAPGFQQVFDGLGFEEKIHHLKRLNYLPNPDSWQDCACMFKRLLIEGLVECNRNAVRQALALLNRVASLKISDCMVCVFQIYGCEKDKFTSSLIAALSESFHIAFPEAMERIYPNDLFFQMAVNTHCPVTIWLYVMKKCVLACFKKCLDINKVIRHFKEGLRQVGLMDYPEEIYTKCDVNVWDVKDCFIERLIDRHRTPSAINVMVDFEGQAFALHVPNECRNVDIYSCVLVHLQLCELFTLHDSYNELILPDNSIITVQRQPIKVTKSIEMGTEEFKVLQELQIFANVDG